MPIDTLAYFQQRLLCINNMSFSSHSLLGSHMNWNGEANANITTYQDSNRRINAIYLEEIGQFLLNNTVKPISFNNIFKLIIHDKHIAFYHERFGKNNLVWLFDLVVLNPTTLISNRDHKCGQDNYSVIITLHDEKICMYWQIIGPKKNELLEYRYW